MVNGIVVWGFIVHGLFRRVQFEVGGKCVEYCILFFVCLFLLNTFFLIACIFCFVAATIVLISVDVLVGSIMLEGDWIICWVFVFRNESSRLGVRGFVDEDSFGIVSFALLEGKCCRIVCVLFLFLMDVLLLLLFVGNGCWWLFKLLLFVVFLLLASVALEFLKISNISFI